MPPIHASPRFLNALRRRLRLKTLVAKGALWPRLHLRPPRSPPPSTRCSTASRAGSCKLGPNLCRRGFRARKPSSETIRDETDALAYALTRLPATYAATASVLRRLSEEIPEFSPSSILDAGCGLASASFAALEIWPDIANVELFDRSQQFLALAGRLTEASPHAALERARVVAADLRAPPPGEAADLVVASYALTEIDDGALPGVVDALWARAGRGLALIEPGTPRDYARLMTLRQRLIGADARIALPCPHDRPCPLRRPTGAISRRASLARATINC